MIRRPPRSTLDRSSAASDVYKRQILNEEKKTYDNYLQEEIQNAILDAGLEYAQNIYVIQNDIDKKTKSILQYLSLIHISEPTRPY